MPQATFRHTAPAPVPAAEVWEALQEAATWAEIGPIDEVFDARHDDEGDLTGFTFQTGAAGRTWEGTARRTAAQPGEHVEFALATGEIRARVGVSLAEDSGGTKITVRLEAESAGMLATLFWGVVREAIAAEMPGRVDRFAAGFAA